MKDFESLVNLIRSNGYPIESVNNRWIKGLVLSHMGLKYIISMRNSELQLKLVMSRGLWFRQSIILTGVVFLALAAKDGRFEFQPNIHLGVLPIFFVISGRLVLWGYRKNKEKDTARVIDQIRNVLNENGVGDIPVTLTR